MIQKINQKLHEETLSYVGEERRFTGLIIENLQKISDSKLFLEMGYASLFEYCTRGLGYSEACAYRRIQAVRVLRVLPEIKEKLNSGHLNLTNLSLAQSLISSANLTLPEKRDVIAKIENCSKVQAERVIAMVSASKGIVVSKHKAERLRSFSYNEIDLSVRIKQETLEKLKRLRSLRAHKNPNMSYAELIEDMCDFMISKLEPKPPKPTSNTTAVRDQRKSAQSRYISAQIRSLVWHRDGGRCTFKSAKHGLEKQCESRHLIQYDHIKPFYLGGLSNAENLRLLCHAHHRDRERRL